jgi:hypothetical protein
MTAEDPAIPVPEPHAQHAGSPTEMAVPQDWQ